MARSDMSGNRQPWHGGAGGSDASGSKTNGIFLGRVKDPTDPEGAGRIKVYIPQLSSGREDDPNGWYVVKYAPIFAGSNNNPNKPTDGTRKESSAEEAVNYQDTGDSYGFWGIPPTKDNWVLCGFIAGDANMGVWWAMMHHDGKSHSVPAIGSGATHPKSPAKGAIRPNAERARTNTDPQSNNRPQHDQVWAALERQGLSGDLRRGHINATQWRNEKEHPGNMYGMLTPGQHSLVLDDGDMKEYPGAIRLRTKSGHQIMMHEEGGFIHIINAAGNAWIELDSGGNIDLYAEADFSVGAGRNINLTAGNNINLEAGANVNLLAQKDINVEACEILNLTGTNGVKLTSRMNFDVFADAHLKITSQRADINSGGAPATMASKPAVSPLPQNSSKGSGVGARVPEKEPYGGHSSSKGGEPISKPGGAEQPKNKNTVAPQPNTDNQKCLDKADIKNARMSDEGLRQLANHEAYRGVAYSDVKGYSVGYGTRVDIHSGPKSSLSDTQKQALRNGPSEPEARDIMRTIVDNDYTPNVTKELAKGGDNMCVTQSQLDSMVMASYNSPAQARSIAKDFVAASGNSPDGRVDNTTLAQIWQNDRHGDSNRAADEVIFAQTGAPNPNGPNRTFEEIGQIGQKSDAKITGGTARTNPYSLDPTVSFGSNQPIGQTGSTQPWQTQQLERSWYLNNGTIPPGSNSTIDQLQQRYGTPQNANNVPPYAPSRVQQ